MDERIDIERVLVFIRQHGRYRFNYKAMYSNAIYINKVQDKHWLVKNRRIIYHLTVGAPPSSTCSSISSMSICSSGDVGFFLLRLPSCVLECLDRWSERMNRLPHSGHAKRFSPVCVRRWRCSSSERVNDLPQKSHWQLNGRSPACHRRCAFKCDVLPYTLPQPATWHTCCFFLWPNTWPVPESWNSKINWLPFNNFGAQFNNQWKSIYL